ncbi:D-2-hydroxyacid dehydrogenase [Kocuria sp. cx-455]|uniref:D-2-hydroxyacid dehydrogenase n=1 Tax=Kocuria sp. cx-455 TaxID=2771377 RepID=UPI002803825F|nr:D-2-hydroxyacid dehydrogenase [Kocuria sp. cx-455]
MEPQQTPESHPAGGARQGTVNTRGALRASNYESGTERRRRPKLVVLTSPSAADLPNAREVEALSEVVYATAEQLPDALPGAQVLLVWDFFSTALRDAWQYATDLEWIHVAAAGVDSLLFDALRDSDITVTNAHGAFDVPIAEFVLASILAHDKHLHRSKELQRNTEWRHRELQQTAGQRALVVGTGGIGRATARLLRAAGLKVTGAGRTERERDRDFGTVVASSDLAQHVGEIDHLVLIAPLTNATRGLLDRHVLGHMKPSAHVVNVGRGALVDEPALVAALREERLAAASLDVFEREPLPGDHPFWAMPTVHISAHMSGDVVGWRTTLAEQFEHNLARWLHGEDLKNVVDKHLGYVRGH